MATKNRDLELRARFKDDASKGAKRVADALKLIGEDAQKATQSVSKSNTAFSDLATDLNKLKSESDKLTAFGNIAKELDAATNSVKRMEGSVRGSVEELAKLSRESEQASVAANRMRAQMAAEEAALEANTAARDEQRTALKAQRDEVKSLQAELKKLDALTRNGASGQTGDLIRRDNLQRQAIPQAIAERDRIDEDVRAYTAAIAANRAEIKGLRPEVNSLAQTEARLKSEVDKSAGSLRNQREKLGEARSELSQIDDAARAGSAALGGLEANQEAISRASARMSQRIKDNQRLLESYNRYATGSGDFTNPKLAASLQKQNEAVRQARDDWQVLEAEIKETAAQMRAAGGSSDEQVAAFRRLSGAARAAKAEYEAQAVALNKLRGVSQSTFAEFQRRVNPLPSNAQANAAAQAQLASATDTATAAQNRLRPAVERTGSALNRGQAGAQGFAGALIGIGRDTRQTLSFMQRLRGEVLALTTSYLGFYGAIQQVTASINAFRDLEAVQSRLGAVFEQDTQRIGQEVTFLRAQADRLGISFATLGNTYAKFAVAANAANFRSQATRDIFLAVAEAGRVNKLSLDQLNGTFLAIEQIISKGKFTSEEVRRQLGDRLPGAFNILADAMGVTTAELDKMMSQGELLSTESNLMKFADELTRRFGPQLSSSLDTLTTDIGRFENNLFKARLAFTEGFIPGLRAALAAFDDFVNSAEGNELFVNLGTAVGKFLVILGEVPEYFEEIVLAVQVFAGLKLAGMLVNISRAAINARNSFVGVGQSMAFIGPQAQAMTLAQRTIGQGFAQVVGSIDRYRGALSAATATNAAARAGIIGLNTSLGFLRGGMLATANVARAMWAAIGGLPGIIATGITFAVGNWITQVGDATTALSEHERQLNAVREAYAATGAEAEDWAKTVKGVTLQEAEANLAKLQAQYNERLKTMDKAANGVKNIIEQLNNPRTGAAYASRFGDEFVASIREIGGALEQFEAGELTLNEFQAAIDGVYKATDNPLIKQMTGAFIEAFKAADEGESNLRELSEAMETQEQVIKILRGEITDLGDDVEDTGKAVKKAFDFKAATEAMRALKGEISTFKSEMEDLEKIDTLNKLYKDAVNLARSMSEVTYLTDLYNQGLNEIRQNAALRIFDGVSGVGGSTAAIIKEFEGFQPTAKYDINAFRAGYGSDTVTLADGTIKKITEGMTVSRADAERDLARRMVEFTNVVKGQIGESRFNSFGEQQQAVLTSVAYNYGSLPERILDAARTGTVAEISQAIRGLQGDNDGINEKRRNQEADIFMANGEVDFQVYYEAEQDRLELIKEQNEKTADRLAQNAFEIEQQKLINTGKEKQAAIEEAVREAREDDPNISEAQLNQIRQQTAALYELQNATKERELSEERVNQLFTLRQQLLEQQKLAEDSGDYTQADNLRERIGEVNTQLREAIKNTIAMWQAVGGPEAEAAIAKLETMGMTIDANANRTIMFGLNMTQVQNAVGSFVDGAVNAFDSFAKKISEGQNAIQALWSSFLQFAADFLRQMAMMILRQQLLNAIAGFGGPIGQAATSLGGVAGHTGGIVGSAAIGSGNQIGRPVWRQHAFKYHSGGVAGLGPDEVSATLKRGEEILTEEDPRHRFNQGGAKSQGATPRLKQVLAIGESEIANAMSSSAGEEVTMTIIRRNASKISRMLKG